MGSQASGQGRLTTHVLDTVSGKPAANLRIELRRIENQQAEILREIRTNADGRCDAPLLAGDALHSGSYELLFHVGEYFGKSDDAIRFWMWCRYALVFPTKRRIIMCRFWFRHFPIQPIAGAERYGSSSQT